MNATTQAERLMRIETLLETQAEKQAEMAADIKAIRKDLDDDKAALAALKNRGTGLLIGVGIAAGSLGAFADRIIDKVLGG